MTRDAPTDGMSRRDLLLGTAATAMSRVAVAESPATRAKSKTDFEVGAFVEECKNAEKNGADSQAAVREALERAMSDPASVLKSVGEPTKGAIQTLYRSDSLTILNIVWAPLMQLMPHEHNMWALIGIYTGREDNIFWQRRGRELEARTAAALSMGSVTSLPRDVIHSVTNPIEKLTGAIHIYGGDFFAVSRSEWDPETLAERDWDIQRAMRLFRESNERFFSRCNTL